MSHSIASTLLVHLKDISDCVTHIGPWDTEWLRESSKYEGIISVILPEAESRLIGVRKTAESVMAIERLADDSGKIIWTAQHQEFTKKIAFNRGDNFLKILRDAYEYFSLAVDIENPDLLIIRRPIEFRIFLDEWTGKRFVIFYTRLSLIKNNEQIMMKFNDSDGLNDGIHGNEL